MMKRSQGFTIIEATVASAVLVGIVLLVVQTEQAGLERTAAQVVASQLREVEDAARSYWLTENRGLLGPDAFPAPPIGASTPDNLGAAASTRWPLTVAELETAGHLVGGQDLQSQPTSWNSVLSLGDIGLQVRSGLYAFGREVLVLSLRVSDPEIASDAARRLGWRANVDVTNERLEYLVFPPTQWQPYLGVAGLFYPRNGIAPFRSNLQMNNFPLTASSGSSLVEVTVSSNGTLDLGDVTVSANVQQLTPNSVPNAIEYDVLNPNAVLFINTNEIDHAADAGSVFARATRTVPIRREYSQFYINGDMTCNPHNIIGTTFASIEGPSTTTQMLVTNFTNSMITSDARAKRNITNISGVMALDLLDQVSATRTEDGRMDFDSRSLHAVPMLSTRTHLTDLPTRRDMSLWLWQALREMDRQQQQSQVDATVLIDALDREIKAISQGH